MCGCEGLYVVQIYEKCGQTDPIILICIKLFGLYVSVVVAQDQVCFVRYISNQHIITHAPACYVFRGPVMFIVIGGISRDCIPSFAFISLQFPIDCSVWFVVCIVNCLLVSYSVLNFQYLVKKRIMRKSIPKVRLLIAVLNVLKERTLALCPQTSSNSSIDHHLHHQNHAIHQHADIIARNHSNLINSCPRAAPVNMKCHPSDTFHLLIAIWAHSLLPLRFSVIINYACNRYSLCSVIFQRIFLIPIQIGYSIGFGKFKGLRGSFQFLHLVLGLSCYVRKL